MNDHLSAFKNFRLNLEKRHNLLALILATLFSVGAWSLGAWLLSNARLLDLKTFAPFLVACIAFFVVLLVTPFILFCCYLYYFLKENINRLVSWLVIVDTLLLLFLGLVHFTTLPDPVNKILFADEITLETLSKQIDKKVPGIYFVSAWQESGSFSPPEYFFAKWIDIPLKYDVHEIYYFHSYIKAPKYPSELTAFLQQYAIEEMPAVIVIDEQNSIVVFQNLGYEPVLESSTTASKQLRAYLDANYSSRE